MARKRAARQGAARGRAAKGGTARGRAVGRQAQPRKANIARPRVHLAPSPRETRSFDADDADAALTVNTTATGHESLGGTTNNSKEVQKFMASPHGYEEGWSGVRFLAAGSFGAAGMWEKKDEQGNIIDQVVIKEIGRPWSASFRPAKPTEVEIMELLNKSNCPGIVRIRAYRRYKKYKKHRIYMEYARYGDLENLRQRYLALNQPFPEKFLWDLFYYLASACMVMSTPSRKTRSKAKVVVHLDIKPPNIFLGDKSRSGPNDFDFYPTPKLGDFGLAELTSRDDPKNPTDYHEVGTNGWRAPEQYSKTLRNKDSETKMLSGTNVWAVGAVMYEYVMRPDPLLGSRYRWPYDEEEDGIPPISAITSTRYSQALCDLVKDCLRPNASSRPTPFQILDKVESARKRFLRDLKRRRKNGDKVPNQEEALSYHNLRPNDPQSVVGRLGSTLSKADFSQWIPQGEHLNAPLSRPPGQLGVDPGEERCVPQ